MILRDYRCHDCDLVHESLEGKSVLMISCPRCDGDSIAIISGTHAKTIWGAADVRGTNDERPPWAMDTRPLAEGETYDNWRKKRKAERRDELRKEVGVERKIISYGK